MDIKVFQQGEGPVNTVGAFKQGPNALLKFPLEEWGIIKGNVEQDHNTTNIRHSIIIFVRYFPLYDSF